MVKLEAATAHSTPSGHDLKRAAAPRNASTFCRTSFHQDRRAQACNVVYIYMYIYPPTPATQGGARQGREVVQLQQPLQHNYNSHCNAKHAASARQSSSSSSTRCNFGFLRPSLPWCFPIWGPAAATAAAKAFAAAGGKGSQNSYS